MKCTFKPLFLLLLISSIAVVSCNDEKEDLTNAVNKEGSVESSVTVEHLDSLHDVLITHHKVWNNSTEFKTIEYRDTLPALGIHNTVAENQDGDTKNVSVKKDYEIFITVK